VSQPPAPPIVDPRIRLARKLVLGLAVLVLLSLATGLLFAAYNFATDRPVKELFQSAPS
jgi:hypothetical protein